VAWTAKTKDTMFMPIAKIETSSNYNSNIVNFIHRRISIRFSADNALITYAKK